MFKIFLSFIFLLILTDDVRCKPDYIFNYEVDGWLKLHSIPTTWEEAFLKCYYEGAVLASPLDLKLTNALYTVLSSSINRDIFLGTHALLSDGYFFSVEGVPLSDMPIYANVSHGSGTDPEPCLTMHVNGLLYYLYTSSCTKQLPYICYRKRGNETSLDPCGTFDNNYHLDQRTGSCYKLHEEKQTWNRANMICAAEGGYLVILNNKQEASIVKDMFPTRDSPDKWETIQIGLRAWSDDRAWITVHGERLENVYHTWEPGQPDNWGSSQACGCIIRNGNMDDFDCDNKKVMFVCEKDPTTARFEPPRHRWKADKLTD